MNDNEKLRVAGERPANLRGWFGAELRLVAVFELAKGLLVLAAGLGLLAFVHRDVEEVAGELLLHLHLNPASRIPGIFLALAHRIASIDLWLLALGAAVYASVIGARAAPAEPPAEAASGERLFADKHCARCHLPRGQRGIGPALEQLRRPQGTYELAGRLWNHAPAMFTALAQEGVAWPEISAAEMADLMAFLLADANRDPPADLFKGRATLVSKGCLKCHSFRKEGR